MIACRFLKWEECAKSEERGRSSFIPLGPKCLALRAKSEESRLTKEYEAQPLLFRRATRNTRLSGRFIVAINWLVQDLIAHRCNVGRREVSPTKRRPPMKRRQRDIPEDSPAHALGRSALPKCACWGPYPEHAICTYQALGETGMATKSAVKMRIGVRQRKTTVGIFAGPPS